MAKQEEIKYPQELVDTKLEIAYCGLLHENPKSISRYYLENKEYISALNRFSLVTDNYQTTAQIEEALYREVEIYTILGLTEEALKKERILTSNYPDSKWAKLAQSLVAKE